MPRQPLFGVFALPFGLASKLLSDILFFVPNIYPIAITTVQIFLLGIVSIMLCRIFKFKNIHERNFIMLYMSSFMVISFAFIIEQYIISLFYLVLVLYCYYVLKRKENYCYVGSVGTLTTNIVLLPFITQTKKIKTYIFVILKCLLIGIGFFSIFGQLPLVFNFVDSFINIFSTFGGDSVSLYNRIIQWVSFVRNIFIAAPASVYSGRFSEYGYYLDDIYNISKFGVLILGICIISFIINRKEKKSYLLFGWILFSTIIMVVLGRGTSENGLNLYSLYFGWSFVILIYMLLKKIIKNEKILNVIVCVLMVCLLIVNILGFAEIVKFGITYYPVK